MRTRTLARIPEPANSSMVTPSQTMTRADSDKKLIQLWLKRRNRLTRAAYTADVKRFRAFLGENLAGILDRADSLGVAPEDVAGRELRWLAVEDLQAFADSLSGPREGRRPLATASQYRTLAAVRSLLSFGFKLGYLPFNVGLAVELPKLKDTLAERLLSEDEVLRILAFETKPRNHALLRLLYHSGHRVSATCALCWKDLTPDGNGSGTVTFFDKGGLTWHVLIKADLWLELQALRNGANDEAAVFVSQKGGGHLSRMQVFRIVKKAATRAKIGRAVSPHWFRHCHVTHNQDRNTPDHVTRNTAGFKSSTSMDRYKHTRPGESSALTLPG